MPKGVPYRVQVAGKGPRTYTFTEIAFGTGLSLSLVSLVLRGKRPASWYAQLRLAEFFGIPVGQLRTQGTIRVELPPVRPAGRIISRRIRRPIYSARLNPLRSYVPRTNASSPAGDRTESETPARCPTIEEILRGE
jgi:transcriptional regulator with XRE-family HTH domain